MVGPVPVPRLGRLAHADGADADRRWRLPVSAAPPSPRSTGARRGFASGCSTRPARCLPSGAATKACCRRGANGFAAILEGHLGAMGAPADAAGDHLRHGRLAPGLDRGALCRTPGALRRYSAGAVARARQRAATSASCRASRSATTSAPDVMRGEETQLAGIASLLGAGSHLVCMPGHALQMGRDRRRRGRRLPHLDDRRTVLGAVQPFDPAPFARRGAACASPPTTRSSGGWLRATALADPRRCRRPPVPHPRLDAAASTCSRTRRPRPCRAC